MPQKFKYLLFSSLLIFAINSVAISLSSRLTPAVQAVDYRNETLINQTLNSQISNQGEIYVHSFNQKLLIIGYVSDHLASQEIRKVLENQPSEVRSFFNEVSFISNFTEPNKTIDNLLRNLLLSRIDNNFPINSIKVIVYDRKVYLMGLVTGPEAEYLKKTASTTRNVREVRAYFDVITSSQADRLAQQIPQTNTPSNSIRYDNIATNLPACPGSDISRWINCFGAYKFANGDIYSGEWNDGKFNGKGIDTSSNGSKYIGDFRDHKRHGKGILYATNGSILQEGTWFNNAFIRSDLVQQVTTPNTELEKLRAEAEEAKRKQAELEQQLRLAQNQPFANTSQSNQTPPLINQGRRVALVIGNASYSSVPKLINPTNDAREVTRALQATGFEVIRLENADLRQMQDAVRSFGNRLGKNDVGLFYFSGHGVQVKGKNYLIPVRENIKQSFEVPSGAIDADLVLATMENAKNNLNIMILDACRSPFPGEARSLSRGLATLDAAKGTLIAYATAPGKEALDGQGNNSPYTKHLVRALQQKGLPIEQVFKQVRIAVVEETKGNQVPWENSSIMGDFYFRK
jgi:hypothetical protein